MNCLGCAMNANSASYNYFSGLAKVSFDGFINENYFEIENKEQNLALNLDIVHAVSKNPINYKKDTFIGLLAKSKYDGIGNRMPIDLSIALDISGSMSNIDEPKNTYNLLLLKQKQKNRLDLARESLKKLVSIMDKENDKLSLITFNHETQKIFGLLNKDEIEAKFLQDIDAIKANGGTDLVGALQAALDNFGENIKDKKEKRIVMITDAMYKDVQNDLLNLFKKSVEEYNISITIITISKESNISLADKLCHFRGCNYFSITKTSELETYLVNNFNYIFFPTVYDIKLTISSKDATIYKCIGGGNELNDKPINEINTNNNEIVIDLGTGFPSELINFSDKDEKDKNKLYVKGGLILLKINPKDLENKKDLLLDFSLQYESFDGKRALQNYSYIIPTNEQGEKENFYKNQNIQKGLSIYYFTEVLNNIVENVNNSKYNSFNVKNEETDQNKKKNDIELFETKQAVRDYLTKNYIIMPNNKETNDNYNNYLKLIEDRYSEYRKIIYRYYHIP